MIDDDFAPPPAPGAGQGNPRRAAIRMVLRWNAIPLLLLALTVFTLYQDGGQSFFMPAPVLATFGGAVLVVATAIGVGVAALIARSSTLSNSAAYGLGTAAAALGWVISFALWFSLLASGAFRLLR
ncbi:hypothetical protein [Catellatospora tritici]|uniref:hypothetical protein n=1 Tax=Catellatospora tritici TaxID=2851566 RepID=UPI001C2D35A2|nr:hypothetical protein [Catellatospora tritici]MBV1852816.1 hypothetical protein [Catellatospora tritici]